ncbi:hypothetical protein SEA_BIG4_368 [Microbacterium phage Big4]|nr:hypothetical protein SEA_BIG4_42 [Microbacterium phage Big4]URP22401.1 hypothetical protein SEA_BIG4_368 [Microbacterium phage Big4]
MATVTTKKNMVMLTNITEADRDVLSILALKGRLGYAIRIGRTDGMALAKARQLAEKYNWPEGMKTMKQAERFVLACHAAWKSE